MNEIRNISLNDLTDYCKNLNQPSYRATQIFEWLYQGQVSSFNKMTNMSKEFRCQLQADFQIGSLKTQLKSVSKDGTIKYVFVLEDKEMIETVLIPTKTRTTVCVSTQAGCKFGCRFCASGIGGWRRNLNSAEILMQVLHVKGEAEKLAKPLSHIVFMGIGEPLDNYDNLIKAIRVINDERGMNIGARRITVSTCGVIPKINKLSDLGLQIELAISLHGYDNESRNILMPVNKKYPFDDLISACRKYIEKTNRQITFEYILIKDVTCTSQAAQELKKAFKSLICKMNLIPYNPVSEFDYETPSKKEIVNFQNQLKQFNIFSTVRTPRGRDVGGACGQLRHRII